MERQERFRIEMQPDSSLIEDRFKDSLSRYVEHRIPTGGFLQAVLENNLTESYSRADSGALVNIPHIVAYCYNKLPSNCWGSPTKVKAWLEASSTDTNGNSVE